MQQPALSEIARIAQRWSGSAFAINRSAAKNIFIEVVRAVDTRFVHHIPSPATIILDSYIDTHPEIALEKFAVSAGTAALERSPAQRDAKAIIHRFQRERIEYDTVKTPGEPG